MEDLIKFAARSFTIPDTAIRVRSALDDGVSDVNELGKLVSVDPNLATKALRLANSALFRFPSQVDTIPRAVSIIGGEALYNIVLAETANLVFEKFSSRFIDAAKFRENAVRSGVIAKAVAQKLGVRGCDRFFAAGVMQFLGEIVIAFRQPTQYQRYTHLRQPYHLHFAEQVQVFGFAFHQCAARVMQEWKLPETLYNPLLDDLIAFDPDASDDVRIMFLSATLNTCLRDGVSLQQLPWLSAEDLETLPLTFDDYEMIMNFANIESEKIAAILAVSSATH